MNILYQEITSRLQKILDLPRTTIPDLFKAWMVEAYKLKEELLSEGLEESAEEDLKKMLEANPSGCYAVCPVVV